MKFIIELGYPGLDHQECVKITSSDDDKHYYLLVLNNDFTMYSMWYDGEQFAYEQKCENIPEAIGLAMKSLLNGYYLRNK